MQGFLQRVCPSGNGFLNYFYFKKIQLEENDHIIKKNLKLELKTYLYKGFNKIPG